MTEFTFDRRTFLRRGAMGAGALWALSLDPFMARRAEGAAIARARTDRSAPKIDETTGLPLIQRSRWIPLHGRTAGPAIVMSDGVRVPEPARRHGGRRRAREIRDG